MIEDLIKENTEALKALTAALLGGATVTAGTVMNTVTAEPAPKRSRKAAPVEEPAPAPATEPATEEPTAEEPATEEPGDTLPTKVAAPRSAKDDTPNVPARTEPGQPVASEHVDVDEVIGQINSAVKDGLGKAADLSEAKAEWQKIREAYGVERVSDLRGEPGTLLEVLKKAKAFRNKYVG